MLVEKLMEQGFLSKDEYIILLGNYTEEQRLRLQAKAVELRKQYYGNKVFVRGLIEFTNYCKNNCYYCGIQASNGEAKRYRLTKEEILECCDTGWKLTSDTVQHLTAFCCGSIGYGTGEDQSSIRHLFKTDSFPPFFHQRRRNAFRFIGIDLTAKITDGKSHFVLLFSLISLNTERQYSAAVSARRIREPSVQGV